MTDQTILIPVEFPDPDHLPETLISGIAGMDVVLLGHSAVEDPGDPEAYWREVRATLYEYAAKLLRAGSEVDVRTVVGDDGRSVRDRIADETGVDAVYVPRPIASFGRLLVALRDDRSAAELADFVAGLNGDVIVHLTLYHVAESESEVEEAEAMLGRVADTLGEAGLPRPSIETVVDVGDDPPFRVGTRAADHDAVVIGETEPTLEDRVFGETYERIADTADEPVIVIRRE